MAAVGLLLLSVFGLFFVQKPLQQTQEIRPDAAVNTGSVFVSAQPNSAITVGQASTIRLAVDTRSIPTTGVQLVFNIHSTAGYQNMTAQVLSSSGLQSAYLELEQTSDGALVGVIALPPGGQQFSTTAPTNFLELNFLPTSPGTIRLNFDNERSIITKHGSNPPEDVLQTIAEVSYSVSGNSSSPSPSPTASPKVSPTPSPTATPSISCNASCKNNDDCPVNFRCYSISSSESRCRLVTNPTSTTCQGVPDQGLNRRCNEYCADSRECAAGFSCWENRCRNPENVDSTSCAALTQTQRQQAAASCNQSCSDNGDCARNLRCYSGRCRLASNPSSQSCSAATTPKVSDSYNTPSKGAEDGSATGSARPQPSPASSPLTVLPNTTDSTPQPPTEETAQDTLLSLIMNAEYSLPLKVLIAGFLLLIIGLIAGGILSRRKNRFAEKLAQPTQPQQPNKTEPPKSGPAAPPTAQQPPTPKLPPTPPAVPQARPDTLTPTHQQTTATKPLQSAFTGTAAWHNSTQVQRTATTPPSAQPVELAISPPPPRTHTAPAHSMLDRMKAKKIQPPVGADKSNVSTN